MPACLGFVRIFGKDVSRHVHITPLVRPGSGDLQALFARGAESVLANDTSCGAGFAPLSNLERMVLEVENALNDPRTKAGYPAIGEDIKVMAVRHAGSVTMTIACAKTMEAAAGKNPVTHVGKLYQLMSTDLSAIRSSRTWPWTLMPFVRPHDVGSSNLPPRCSEMPLH